MLYWQRGSILSLSPYILLSPKKKVCNFEETLKLENVSMQGIIPDQQAGVSMLGSTGDLVVVLFIFWHGFF